MCFSKGVVRDMRCTRRESVGHHCGHMNTKCVHDLQHAPLWCTAYTHLQPEALMLLPAKPFSQCISGSSIGGHIFKVDLFIVDLLV